MPIMTRPVRKCRNCDNEFYRENGVDEDERLCSDPCYEMYYAEGNDYESGEDGYQWSGRGEWNLWG